MRTYDELRALFEGAWDAGVDAVFDSTGPRSSTFDAWWEAHRDELAGVLERVIPS